VADKRKPEKPDAPTSLSARRRIKDFVQSLPAADERKFDFQAGQIILREGDDLQEDVPAILVVQGTIEERIYYFVPGKGQVSQTVKRVMQGQIANIQALVPTFRDKPALCSIHAIEDGHAIRLDADAIRSLREVGWLMAENFRHQVELLESMSRMNALYGGLYSLLEDIHIRRPELPSDPIAILQDLVDAHKRIDSLQNDLRERQLDLDAMDMQMNDQTLEIDERERQIVCQKHQLKQFESELVQTKQELAWQHGVLEETSKENLAFTRYYRKLESMVEERDREIEKLKRQIRTLSSQDDPRIAFRTLTDEILKAQEATASAKQAQKQAEMRMVQMHRAIELLSKDNPNLKLSDIVMLMLMGEEPEDLPPLAKSVDDEIDAVFREAGDSLPPPSPDKSKTKQG
jgi:CRP-like cAMP-binding protein